MAEMTLPMQYLICGLLLLGSMLGLARSYGWLGRRRETGPGCSKGCHACQGKAATQAGGQLLSAATPVIRTKRLRLR